MRLENINRARHKSGLSADGKGDRIKGTIGRAEGSGLGDLVKFGSGRILSFGQAINAVIEEEHLDAHVAAQHVDGVISADGESIAVAGGHPNFQLWMRDFYAAGNRRRAAVNRVEAIGVHVIRETA